jgi:hypothetical protein
LETDAAAAEGRAEHGATEGVSMENAENRWTPEDQRRVERYAHDLVSPILASGDSHLVLLAVGAYLLATDLLN